MTAVRRPAAVAVLVGIVVAFAWFELLWQPQSAALAAAHRQSANASTSLFEAGQRLGHLNHLSTETAQLTALDNSLRAAVPTGDDLDGFLLSLNAMAQTSNVVVRSLTPGQTTAAPGGLSSLGIGMTVEGGYFDVQRFLDQLKAGARLVVIDAMSEAPLSSSTPGARVSAQITAHLLSGLTASAQLPTGGTH